MMAKIKAKQIMDERRKKNKEKQNETKKDK